MTSPIITMGASAKAAYSGLIKKENMKDDAEPKRAVHLLKYLRQCACQK
jgi:hypothetical protein